MTIARQLAGGGEAVPVQDPALDLLARHPEGLTVAEIAEQLVIAESTVKTHVSHLMKKYDVPSRLKLVVAVHREREAAL